MNFEDWGAQVKTVSSTQTPWADLILLISFLLLLTAACNVVIVSSLCNFEFNCWATVCKNWCTIIIYEGTGRSYLQYHLLRRENFSERNTALFVDRHFNLPKRTAIQHNNDETKPPPTPHPNRQNITRPATTRMSNHHIDPKHHLLSKLLHSPLRRWMLRWRISRGFHTDVL